MNPAGTALCQLRRFQFYHRQHRKALDCFERAIQLNPEFAIAWFNKGVRMLAMDRLNEAKGSFEQALTIDPKFAEACYHLGLTLEKTGHIGKAHKYYQRTQKLNPKLPGLKEKLKDLKITT